MRGIFLVAIFFFLVGVPAAVVAQLRPSYFDDRVIPQQTVYPNESDTPKTNQTGCELFTQTLYTGITDAATKGEVSRLQKFLGVKVGKPGKELANEAVQGVYDDATEWAVRKYQKQYDILKPGISCKTGYGVVEQKTRDYINKTNDCTPVIARKTVSCGAVAECPLIRTNITKGTADAEGVRGAVSTLQCYLKSIGLYKGPVDGFFGSSLQSAVTQYQTTRKLGVTGVVNAQTRAAISECSAATAKAESGHKAKSAQYTLRIDPARGKGPLKVTMTFAFNGSTCSSYELNWGDGTLADSYDAGRPATCAPLPVTQSYTHVYTKVGTYDITVRQGEDSLSRLPVSNSAQVIVE